MGSIVKLNESDDRELLIRKVNSNFKNLDGRDNSISGTSMAIIEEGFVKKTGDSMTGSYNITGSGYVLNMSSSTGGEDIAIKATRTDTGKSVYMGVGSGGQNRGVYDLSGSKWMIHSDSANRTIIPDTLYLTRTTDASGTANNNPALMIGDYAGTHLELDGNEIMAKASGTTTGPLYLNNEGGATYVRGNPFYGAKVLYSNTSGNTGTVTLNETAANFTFIEIYYGLTGIGTVTGSTQFVKVYSPNGKSPYLNLNWYYSSDGGGYTRVRKVTISGSSITTVSGWGANWTHSGWRAAIDDALAIWAVVGYK